MIARTWTVTILTSDTIAYTECATRVRIPQTRAAQGNLGAWVLIRDLDAGYTEVLCISHWAATANIEAWAGYDIDNPLIFDEERHFFVVRELEAHHYILAAGSPDPDSLLGTTKAGPIQHLGAIGGNIAGSE